MDEQVLQKFPIQTRRKILRWLYTHHLVKTKPTKKVRQQFVDAFLVACKVGIFLSNTEICKLGFVFLDMFMLVKEIAKASTAQTNNACLLTVSARQTTRCRSWKRGILSALLCSLQKPARPSW